MSSYGRANFGARNNKNLVQDPVNIVLTGWNNASASECISFIQKKTNVRISNYHTEQAELHGTVKSQQDAQTLVSFSGLRFAGQPLKFRVQESTSLNTREILENFLKSRYDPNTQFLNFSGVQNDPALQSIGFFRTTSTAARFFPALMKVAELLKLEVISADISGNNISDLDWISDLPRTFPRLRNLSLQNNKLGSSKPFETWKKKLVFLRELLIEGNPFMTRVQPAELKSHFRRIFPRLIVLNGEVIRNEEIALANFQLAFEPPQPIFFQDEVVQNVSTSFITNFIGLWDTDRKGLMGLFQPQSQFSLQVDSSAPHSIGASQTPDFGYYMTHSRNLSKVLMPKSRQSKLAVGQEQIFAMFSKIPHTKHDLVNRPSAYSMEAHNLPEMGAICITLHGSFSETAPPDIIDKVSQQHNRSKGPKNKRPDLGVKCFDRTFIVVPGANNSVVVASDMLCVRAEVDPDAFVGQTVARSHAQAAQPQGSPAPPVGNAGVVPGIPVGALPSPAPQFAIPDELKNSLSPIQLELLLKILEETKLTVEYGLMLCQQSNWDYQQCGVNFTNSSASLPPNAFR